MKTVNFNFSIPDTNIGLISSTLQPFDPNFSNTLARFQTILFQNNYAYVVSNAGDSAGVIGLSLAIYDISNVLAPVAVSYITTGSVPWVSGPSYLNSAYMAAIQGNYLYVASSGSSVFYVVNIENPSNPFNVAALTITNSPGSLYGISLFGDYVYLATQSKGLTVVNISNPLAPTQVFQEGGTLNKSIGVFTYGNYCYTTNYQTTSPWTVRYLKIWSLANPASPSLLTTFTLLAGTKPAEVMVSGNTAFVSDLNTNSIQIVNITNPLEPAILSSLQASASFYVANSVSLYGNFAYVSSGGNSTYGGAIDFFDITNLSSPILVKTVTQNVAGSVFGASSLNNNLLYVANYGTTVVGTSTLNIYSTQTAFSDSFQTEYISKISAQFSNIISSVTGQYSMQGSNDNVNWSNIPNTQGTITGSGIPLVAAFDCSYEYVRLAYTNTGSAGVTCTLKEMGMP